MLHRQHVAHADIGCDFDFRETGTA